MEKLKSGKIQIISKQGRSMTGGTASKRFSFFGFSATAPSKLSSPTPQASVKEPLLKGIHLSKTSGRRAAIEEWVDLEEKIVHDYANRKAAPSKLTPPLSISPSVSYASAMPVLQRPLPGKNPSSRWGAVLWISGWALAVLFAFFYARELPLKQEASSRIAGIMTEKSRLEQSYAEIKTVSEEQRGKLRELNSRIQRMNGELQTFRDKSADVRLLEKAYRQELMRITTDYEIQLDSLRGFLRTRDEIIAALRAQMQAIEKMIDQGSLSAVSGVASRAARRDSFAPGEELPQGRVTRVNTRQGFLVVNIGVEQGARSGREVRIYREGVLIGQGVADRVYPTMSSVTLTGRAALYAVREGDLISF